MHTPCRFIFQSKCCQTNNSLIGPGSFSGGNLNTSCLRQSIFIEYTSRFTISLEEVFFLCHTLNRRSVYICAVYSVWQHNTQEYNNNTSWHNSLCYLYKTALANRVCSSLDGSSELTSRLYKSMHVLSWPSWPSPRCMWAVRPSSMSWRLPLPGASGPWRLLHIRPTSPWCPWSIVPGSICTPAVPSSRKTHTI
jgi:hypothetical protein